MILNPELLDNDWSPKILKANKDTLVVIATRNTVIMFVQNKNLRCNELNAIYLSKQVLSSCRLNIVIFWK